MSLANIEAVERGTKISLLSTPLPHLRYLLWSVSKASPLPALGAVAYHSRRQLPRYGIRWVTEGESYLRWRLLERSDAEALVRDGQFERLGDAAICLADMPAPHYGGPGRSFAHEPFVRICRTRVLVIQKGGLDI